MEILIPIVEKTAEGKIEVSFHAITNVYQRQIDRGGVIAINEFDEETKFDAEAKEIFGHDLNPYQVIVEPRSAGKEISTNDIELLFSIPLGILLAIEKMINFRFFKEQYSDTLIVVGDVSNGRLLSVNDINRIYDIACEYENKLNKYNLRHTKKVHFLYVSDENVDKQDDDLNSHPELNPDKPYLSRLEPGMSYKETLKKLFTAVGDEELTKFFEDWGEKDGLPYGRNELKDKKLIKYRDFSYMFIYEKEKELVGVRKINSAGLPYAYSGSKEDPVFQEFYYHDSDIPNKRNITVLYKTKSGNTIYRKEIERESNNSYKVTFYNCLDAGPFFFNSDFMEYKPETIISVGYLPDAFIGKEWRVECNQHGFVTNKLAIRSNNEIYGMEYSYDEDDKTGNIRKEYFLGQDGNPIAINGIVGYEMQYDKKNNMIERKVIYSPGTAHNDSNWNRAVFKHDLRNRQTGCSFYNDQGECYVIKTNWRGFPRAIKTDYGNIILRREYDWLGYCVSLSVLDDKNKPTYGRIGNTICSEIQRVFNEGTLPIEISYHDIEQELTCRDDGVAVIKTKYDIDRNRIEETYLGIYENTTEDERGIAQIKQYYEYHKGGEIGRFILLYRLSELDDLYKDEIQLGETKDGLAWFMSNPVKVPNLARDINAYLYNLPKIPLPLHF